MNKENVERAVVERVLTIAPGIASAEVIVTRPISLPEEAQGEAYFGLVVIGAGKELPGANVQTRGIQSFKGSAHEKTLIESYFVIVGGGKTHIYLDNHTILNFLSH